MPQALPVIKVVGPHKRAPDWTAARVLTKVAYRQACEADPMEAQASLRLAYGEVVNCLEREIEGMTDGAVAETWVQGTSCENRVEEDNAAQGQRQACR